MKGIIEDGCGRDCTLENILFVRMKNLSFVVVSGSSRETRMPGSCSSAEDICFVVKFMKMSNTIKLEDRTFHHD